MKPMNLKNHLKNINMIAIAWILVWILASIGLVCTPCLIGFYRKTIRLEKENNDLMEAMIMGEVRLTSTVIQLEIAKQEILDLKSQF